MPQPEDRPVRATLADVAKLAGVSKATVSYTYSRPARVSEPTRAKVMAAAKRLGFQGPSAVGRMLVSGRTRVIAIVTAMLVDTTNDDRFSLSVLEGLLRELAPLGYGSLVLSPATSPGTESLLGTLAFDGAVAIQRRSHHHETDQIILGRGVPLLRLDGNAEDDRAYVLQEDHAVAQIIEKLRDDGHERIATATLFFDSDHRRSALRSPGDIPDAKPAPVRARLAGFARAGIVPSHIYECAYVQYAEGYKAGLALLSLPDRPTAIVCQADVLAAGVIGAARELDLAVPGDVSVTGFDALPGPDMESLNLTTVHQSGLERGRAAARWIVGVVEGHSPPPAVIEATVRWGATTGPAPATSTS